MAGFHVDPDAVGCVAVGVFIAVDEAARDGGLVRVEVESGAVAVHRRLVAGHAAFDNPPAGGADADARAVVAAVVRVAASDGETAERRAFMVEREDLAGISARKCLPHCYRTVSAFTQDGDGSGDGEGRREIVRPGLTEDDAPVHRDCDGIGE